MRNDAVRPGPSGVASTSGNTDGSRGGAPGTSSGWANRIVDVQQSSRAIQGAGSIPGTTGSLSNTNTNRTEGNTIVPYFTPTPVRIVNSPARLNSSINEFRSPKRRRIESPGKKADLSLEIDEEAEVNQSEISLQN